MKTLQHKIRELTSILSDPYVVSEPSASKKADQAPQRHWLDLRFEHTMDSGWSRIVDSHGPQEHFRPG